MRAKAEGLTLEDMVMIIAEAAIRRAAGLNYDLSPLPRKLQAEAEAIIEEVAREIASHERGIVHCKLCGKGPFTRKGFLLHARRVHMNAVKAAVREMLRLRLLG